MIHLGDQDPQLDGIWLSPSFEPHTSNVYVMDEGRTLIDAGNTTDIMHELDAKYTGGVGRLERIILTHPHYDHVGALGRLLIYCNADVYLHEEAFAYTFLGDASLPEIARNAGTLDKLLPLREGDVLEVGAYDLEVIYTPGHTPGGICLYHRDSQTLFSEDVVYPSTEDTNFLSEPDHQTGDWDVLIESIRRLMGYQVERLLPGHLAPVMQDGWQHIVNAFFETVRHVEDDYTACVRTAAVLADYGRLEDAVDYYDGALILRPNNVGAKVSKGLALTELGRFEEALTLFEESLEVEPDIEDAQIGKGFALLGLGRTEEALGIEAFKQKVVAAR
ncbi:MAG: MBL fold metallo-hydrolase [Anaerolineae bacterium]